MSMTCDRVSGQLSDYHDRELTPLHRWWIGSHLRRCRRCASSAESLGQVDVRMRRALLATEAPDYLTAAVMCRLPAMPPARRRRSARWFLGTGCAMLQVVALWGAYRCGGSRAQMGFREPISP